MKMIGFISWIAVGFLSLAASAQASPFLSIDFGTMGGTKSPLQSGFQYFKDGVGVGGNVAPISQAYSGFDSSFTNASGTVTVTLNTGTNLTSTTNMTTRDRSTNTSLTSFAFGNLYRDILIAGSNTMSIGISGLTASMQYDLTFYTYDDSSTSTATFTNYTTGSADSANAQAISWTAGYQFAANTPSDIFAKTFTVTANSSGQILFREVTSSGSAFLDGLTISAAPVPEPAALTLALAPLSALLLLRRK